MGVSRCPCDFAVAFSCSTVERRLPQHADQHRPRRLVLLQVDQQLAERLSLRVPPEGADRVRSVEVREPEDVAEFGVSGRGVVSIPGWTTTTPPASGWQSRLRAGAERR